jgi:DNA anti-recombination protein RmuC
MPLELKVDLFIHDARDVSEKLAQLTQSVARLEERVTMKADELNTKVEELRTALKDATDEVARDLERIRAEFKAALEGGLTAEQATSLQAQLDTSFGPVVARLVELGVDPANPVPPPPPATP